MVIQLAFDFEIYSISITKAISSELEEWKASKQIYNCSSNIVFSNCVYCTRLWVLIIIMGILK